jgi:hypothetical protein
MTSGTAPSPYVASSSGAYDVYTVYHIFDGVLAGNYYWLSESSFGPWWVKLDLGAGNTKKLGSYKITVQGTPTAGPAAWTMQGSNDDSTWDTLDTVSGEAAWSANESRTYTCDVTTTAYRYFRLWITATGSYGTRTVMDELYLYEAEASGTAYTDSDTSAATAAASGVDVSDGVSAGTSAASAAAPGGDAFAGASAGIAVASAAALGSDAIDHADSGVCAAAAVADGSDTFSGHTEYDDADSAYAQAVASGSDVFDGVDSGISVAVAVASGTSVNPALPTVHRRYPQNRRTTHGLRQR